MSERGLDQNVAYAIDSVRRDLLPYFGTFSVPVPVVFPAANTDRDVAHGLKEVPQGYHVIEADGPVTRRPGPWAFKEIAYLRSSVVGTRATIIFFTLREVRSEL